MSAIETHDKIYEYTLNLSNTIKVSLFDLQSDHRVYWQTYLHYGANSFVDLAVVVGAYALDDFGHVALDTGHVTP